MEIAAFLIAAILCASFGGPLWATVTLAVLAGASILAELAS